MGNSITFTLKFRRFLASSSQIIIFNLGFNLFCVNLYRRLSGLVIHHFTFSISNLVRPQNLAQINLMGATLFYALTAVFILAMMGQVYFLLLYPLKLITVKSKLICTVTIWIAILPIGNLILFYNYAGIFRLSDLGKNLMDSRWSLRLITLLLIISYFVCVGMSAWVFKHYARLAYHYLIKYVLQALVSQLLLLLFSAILLIFIPTPTWSYIFMRIGQIAVGVILIQQLRQNQPIWSLKVRSGIVSISALILLFINVLPILTIPQAHMVSQWQWIAHRGVNGNDGVQNSIGALRQTHLKYPSYIELDLRLTKDQKFVVMHDPNTYHLTGKREDIAQHTQEQLRRLVLTEYQKHAHIASFDTYLSVANRLHQPLMVELKTVPGDPAAHIAQLFTSRYQRRLAQNHAIVHASNLRLLQALKHQHFKLPVGYIVPFSFWQTSGGQYDYESSNGRSYCAALPLVGTISKKQHYLWTENDPHSFILYDIGIQGLITDQLSLIQSEFKKQNNIFSKITVNMFLLFRLFC